MSRVEERLEKLGLVLPSVPPAGGNYVPAVRAGNLLFTAGNVPFHPSGGYRGRVGAELSQEEGYEAARLCVLNCLAGVKAAIGDLDLIERVVKVTGFVNAGTGFDRFPLVVNGASDLLVSLFGENGRHARTALGLFVPDNYAVEVEMVLQLRE